MVRKAGEEVLGYHKQYRELRSAGPEVSILLQEARTEGRQGLWLCRHQSKLFTIFESAASLRD